MTGKLSEGRNLIAIEVTGYNVNSFYTLDQESFIQTEMVSDGAYASCNHGFASHIVHVLYRDVLGVSKLDIQNRKI